MVKPTCLTCRYWASPHGLDHPFVGSADGTCHRRAPERVAGEFYGKWPFVNAQSSCGEYKHAPPIRPADTVWRDKRLWRRLKAKFRREQPTCAAPFKEGRTS